MPEENLVVMNFIFSVRLPVLMKKRGEKCTAQGACKNGIKRI